MEEYEGLTLEIDNWKPSYRSTRPENRDEQCATAMKTALICGISGQDGAWLAKLLLEKDYRVFGSSRDAQVSSFSNLKKLGIYDRISYKSMAHNDFRSLLQVLIQVEPDEVYNLVARARWDCLSSNWSRRWRALALAR